MTPPESGRDGLRELADRLDAQYEKARQMGVPLGYGWLVSALGDACHDLRRILAEHPATGDEERPPIPFDPTDPDEAEFLGIDPPASDDDSDNAAAGGAEGLAEAEVVARIVAAAFTANRDDTPFVRSRKTAASILTSGWLTAHVAKAKAKALREAADALDKRWYQKEAAMPDSHETSCWLDGHESAELFLRDRADRIEGTR